MANGKDLAASEGAQRPAARDIREQSLIDLLEAYASKAEDRRARFLLEVRKYAGEVRAEVEYLERLLGTK